MDSFFKAFGALQVPLGSHLGPSEAVLDGLGHQKGFRKFRSWYFEGIDGPLGRILAPLGPIWSQNRTPKLLQKLTKNGATFGTPLRRFSEVQMKRFWELNESGEKATGARIILDIRKGGIIIQTLKQARGGHGTWEI